jgi:predicted enzyme related to lactoylglutathione lyase
MAYIVPSPGALGGGAVDELNLGWPIWVGVVVDDLERERRFYRDVLGLAEREGGDGWAQFDMGWPNVLELIRRSDAPEYRRVGYVVAFAVQDIEAARRELLARGVEPVTGIEGGPESLGYWCYFLDPEGHLFEVTQRLGGPPEGWT